MPAHVAAHPLGRPSRVPQDSWRHRIREKPGLGQVYRLVVFVAGLFCVAAGLALSVLPGPLTIPPILLGLWVWSIEFAWAQRLFRRFRIKARQAWRHARAHPASSIAVTVGGLLLLVVAVWALR
ncbi:MAG TPA: PGPGW domain-containing protein, partial [Pseudonocardia sp.]|nr:PGPGW domain-containing protein [Pseudonocardia sp.]